MKPVVLAMCCAVLLAACGGSGKANGHQAAYDAGLKFAKCMRAHGLSNFPDPSGGGGGIQIPVGDASSPAFQSAQKACSKDLPGPGFLGPASEAQKQNMLHMAQCMRAHGLASFPDPVSKPPSPGAGLGLAFGRPGAFIAIPQSMLNSPDFNRAASACGLPGAGRLAGRASRAPAASKQ
ncbi:MAG TPA: hypothetical protein VG321_08300 [Solirubrobacteraceae bacterium]|nr:hypothetical protein [Solirubrobacteraceae bacterium]